jgi:hypothetical protein
MSIIFNINIIVIVVVIVVVVVLGTKEVHRLDSQGAVWVVKTPLKSSRHASASWPSHLHIGEILCVCVGGGGGGHQYCEKINTHTHTPTPTHPPPPPPPPHQ